MDELDDRMSKTYKVTIKNFKKTFCYFIEKEKVHKLFIVCGTTCNKLPIIEEIKGIPVNQIWFSNFVSNPRYDSVVEAVRIFKTEGCDAILAIGGGSAMDVAKCIKLFATMDDGKSYLEQPYESNDILMSAIPTTAGTGSEATQFAVIYHNEIKQSVMHKSIIPSHVFFIPELLSQLPEYQKKVTVMDAMCHAIESFWSIHSTDESKRYSSDAIQLILKHLRGFLDGNHSDAVQMLYASNLAGKAINIAKTTAGHAMCYKISSIYGISHGHAAVLCLIQLWRYMVIHLEECVDPRGQDYLKIVFDELSSMFAYADTHNGLDFLERIILELNLEVPHLQNKEQLNLLVTSVNIERLKNNPIRLTEEAIKELYQKILK